MLEIHVYTGFIESQFGILYYFSFFIEMFTSLHPESPEVLILSISQSQAKQACLSL